MRVVSRSVIAAVALALMAVAGCDTQGDPAPPPPSQDALTTTTPSDDVVATSDAAPTTAEPTEADGPMDRTEEGAVAFVEHYIATLNAVHERKAEVQDLRELATETCKTCKGFADAAEQVRFDKKYLKHLSSDGLLLGDGARVTTQMEQIQGSKEIDTVFTLTWSQEQWLISEIQLAG